MKNLLELLDENPGFEIGGVFELKRTRVVEVSNNNNIP